MGNISHYFINNLHNALIYDQLVHFEIKKNIIFLICRL